MGRAIEVWEGEGGACGWVAYNVSQSTRAHRRVEIGALYAIMIVVVLAVATKLY
jgi:hypothetical protein